MEEARSVPEVALQGFHRWLLQISVPALSTPNHDHSAPASGAGSISLEASPGSRPLSNQDQQTAHHPQDEDERLPMRSSETKSQIFPFPAIKERFELDGYKYVEELLQALRVPIKFAEETATLYARVFCILLEIGKGAAIIQFLDQPQLRDQNLPFTVAELGPSLELTDAHSFYATQWAFCPLVISSSGGTTNITPQRILPFTERTLIARGESTIVYKVKIHAAYDHLILPFHDVEPYEHDHQYILKSFHGPQAISDFQREVATFNQLQENKSRDIINYFESFRHKDTLNIILEYANAGTLEQALLLSDPPSSSHEITAIWSQALGLVRALTSIHDVSHVAANSADGRRAHFDIKPQNILVMTGNGTSRFKLGNLNDSYFRAPVDPRYSQEATSHLTGTDEYGAPEMHPWNQISNRDRNDFSRNADVFSLGLILLDVAVWLTAGRIGFLQYHNRRRSLLKQETDPDSYVESLVSLVEPTYSRSDHLTQRFLDITLRDALLSRPEARSTSGQLWFRLEAPLASVVHKFGNVTTLNRRPIGFISETSSERLLQWSKVREPSTYFVQEHKSEPFLSVSELVRWRTDRRKLEKILRNGPQLPFAAAGLRNLEQRDHVFLVDNSKSMVPYWQELKALIGPLVYLLRESDPDGVEVVMNDSTRGIFGNSSKLMDFLNKVQFSDDPDTSREFDKVLARFLSGDSSLMTQRLSKSMFRPLSIYVLTNDSSPINIPRIVGSVRGVSASCEAESIPFGHIGVQFIRFGGDSQIQTGLKRLDDDLRWNRRQRSSRPKDKAEQVRTYADIVDTERSDGNVWKMLLGSITLDFDDDISYDRRGATSSDSGSDSGDSATNQTSRSSATSLEASNPSWDAEGVFNVLGSSKALLNALRTVSNRAQPSASEEHIVERIAEHIASFGMDLEEYASADALQYNVCVLIKKAPRRLASDLLDMAQQAPREAGTLLPLVASPSDPPIFGNMDVNARTGPAFITLGPAIGRLISRIEAIPSVLTQEKSFQSETLSPLTPNVISLTSEVVPLTPNVISLTSEVIPLTPKVVQSSWTCSCGYVVDETFEEYEPGAVSEHSQAYPENTKTHGSSGGQNAWKLFRDLQLAVSDRIIDVSSMLSSLLLLWRRRRRRKDDEDNNGEPGQHSGDTEMRGSSEEARYLFVCITLCGQETRTRMIPLNMAMKDDRSLFRFLRKEYRTVAGLWRRTLGLKRLCGIRFVQFQMTTHPSWSIYRHSEQAGSKDEVLPPSIHSSSLERLDWFYHPNPRKFIPPITSDRLVHLCNCTHECLDKSYCKDRFPKHIRDQPRIQDGEDEVASWGIELIEGRDWAYFWILGLIVITMSLAFGITWACVMKDISGGFTVASYMTGGAACLVGTIQFSLDQL